MKKGLRMFWIGVFILVIIVGTIGGYNETDSDEEEKNYRDEAEAYQDWEDMQDDD